MNEENSMDELTRLPYVEWLEDIIKEIVESEPTAIAVELVDKNGQANTRYWECSPNDRAIMIDVMREDALWEFIARNREQIVTLLSEDEDGDEDEEV